jgi:tRNA(His) guanylyltransferase
MTTDNFGDRMKAYEALETERRLMPLLPVYVRIDGRCFSKFTHGMKRPFDQCMSECMIATTMTLVEKTHARIGYTQSDEISLVYLNEDPKGETLFGGKVQKLASVLAALATSAFCARAAEYWPDRVVNMLPHFDARAFSLPSKTEAVNAILWREQDATKNAISMAARSVYSHKDLHEKNGGEMQEMLFAKGINFNDYPDFFKRGTFVRREVYVAELSAAVLAKIPEGRRPVGPVMRTRVATVPMPKFSTVLNRVEVVFDGADPVTA